LTEQKRSDGEQLAVAAEPSHDGKIRSVEGIDTRTSSVNPDSGIDTAPHPTLNARGGSEQGGMAGPVGQFEGEGNEGGFAPLAGDVTKSARDGKENSQGGVASGAPG
jgi:hypothetical protein